MPKATCPACQTDVRYSADAETGDTATCPECDEVFVPPKLRKKKKRYDPEEEDTYKVGRAESDLNEKEKTRKVGNMVRAAMARERERKKKDPRPLIGGFEIVLLVFAAMATAGFGLGYTVAKRFPTAGEGALIVISYCGIMLIYAVRMIRHRLWIEG